MIAIVLLLIISFVVLINTDKKPYDYKCFLLTVKGQHERQEKFFKSNNNHIPLEVIYGPNTKDNITTAREYEELILPEYFEKAVEMYYDPNVKRPDITYFNIGAIGCFIGHMEFYDRCFKQGLKYAVIFEDNVVIKSGQLYDEIQKVIEEKGDDFDMCFFHCLSRLPYKIEGTLEKVKWISSTKCYLINVKNMKKYKKYFYPMDNHVDMKHEDLIAKGCRIYYKDMRNYMKIDRTHKSLIGHSDHGRTEFFSRQYPNIPRRLLRRGY